MKLSIVVSLLAIAAVRAEEGSVRKRELVSAGGSVNVPLCFSEGATVEVLGKGAVPMKDLAVGDRVFTGETYQSLYAFAHLDRTTKAEFVQIHTEQGNTLEATGGHLVYVDGKTGPVRADSIQVGDLLQGTAVTKIGSVERTGLYAPLTTDGKLIVDGVKASNYVALEQAENNDFLAGGIHGFSHFGISPFRLLCTKVSSNMCEAYNEDGVPAIVAGIYQTFDWFMGLPSILQAAALAVYIVIAAMTWTMECLLTTPAVVSVVLAAAALAAKASGIQIQTKKTKAV